ncbi:MAG: hypothetical protein HQK53_12835 [Oligoflexia bacterium]|nr:hypothetical protein [Oligoflexia bacterium]
MKNIVDSILKNFFSFFLLLALISGCNSNENLKNGNQDEVSNLDEIPLCNVNQKQIKLRLDTEEQCRLQQVHTDSPPYKLSISEDKDFVELKKYFTHDNYEGCWKLGHTGCDFVANIIIKPKIAGKSILQLKSAKSWYSEEDVNLAYDIDMNSYTGPYPVLIKNNGSYLFRENARREVVSIKVKLNELQKILAGNPSNLENNQWVNLCEIIALNDEHNSLMSIWEYEIIAE